MVVFSLGSILTSIAVVLVLIVLGTALFTNWIWIQYLVLIIGLAALIKFLNVDDLLFRLIKRK